jgi:hypothetical protein
VPRALPFDALTFAELMVAHLPGTSNPAGV